MCFDIDVTNFTLEQLRETLRRISMLLSKPSVLKGLPDNGIQLHQVIVKLKKEIEFRENLERTCHRVQALSLKCASDTNIGCSHTSKVCSFEKKPQRERFKPHSSLKPTGRTESTKELHSGTKLIDLTTSLSIQKFQEERVKEEQIRVKQERLLNFLKQNETDDDSDDWILNDYDSDVGSEEEEDEEEDTDVTILYSVDEPGPSGLGKRKKPKIEPKDEDDIKKPVEEIQPQELNAMKTEEPKEEADGPEEEKIESSTGTNQPEVIEPKVDGKINVDESKKDIEEPEDKIQLKTEMEVETEKPKEKSKGPEEEIQPSTTTEPKHEAIDPKKDSSYPKDEPDMS